MIVGGKDVALLCLIAIVQQSSSFVFALLCIFLRCWLLLSLLLAQQIREPLPSSTGRPIIGEGGRGEGEARAQTESSGNNCITDLLGPYEL